MIVVEVELSPVEQVLAIVPGLVQSDLFHTGLEIRWWSAWVTEHKTQQEGDHQEGGPHRDKGEFA